VGGVAHWSEARPTRWVWKSRPPAAPPRRCTSWRGAPHAACRGPEPPYTGNMASIICTNTRGTCTEGGNHLPPENSADTSRWASTQLQSFPRYLGLQLLPLHNHHDSPSKSMGQGNPGHAPCRRGCGHSVCRLSHLHAISKCTSRMGGAWGGSGIACRENGKPPVSHIHACRPGAGGGLVPDYACQSHTLQNRQMSVTSTSKTLKHTLLPPPSV